MKAKLCAFIGGVLGAASQTYIVIHGTVKDLIVAFTLWALSAFLFYTAGLMVGKEGQT